MDEAVPGWFDLPWNEALAELEQLEAEGVCQWGPEFLYEGAVWDLEVALETDTSVN